MDGKGSPSASQSDIRVAANCVVVASLILWRQRATFGSGSSPNGVSNAKSAKPTLRLMLRFRSAVPAPAPHIFCGCAQEPKKMSLIIGR
jgi:hypothetical protein